MYDKRSRFTFSIYLSTFFMVLQVIKFLIFIYLKMYLDLFLKYVHWIKFWIELFFSSFNILKMFNSLLVFVVSNQLLFVFLLPCMSFSICLWFSAIWLLSRYDFLCIYTDCLSECLEPINWCFSSTSGNFQVVLFF